MTTSEVENIDTTIAVTVLPDQPIPMPAGTAIVSVTGNIARVRIDYDYGPFKDPESPEFEFVGDILEVNPEGQNSRRPWRGLLEFAG